MKEVLSVVKAVRKRAVANLALRHFFDAAFYAAAALAAAALAAKIVFFPGAMILLTWAALAGLLAALAYAALAARLGLFDASVATDDGFAMAERFSTAILVADSPSPMAMAVVEDARMHAARLRIGNEFPVRLPERWWRLAAALFILSAVLVLPQFDPFGRQAAFVRKKQEKEAVAADIKELQKKIEEMRKTLEGKEFAAAGELDDLEARLVDLEKMGLGKKETLAAISRPLEQLAERMKEAARDMSKNLDKAKSDLAKALAEKQNLAETRSAIEAAMRQLSELSERARQPEQAETSREAAEELAKALEALAEQLSRDSDLAEELREAAEALKSGDAKSASQAMQSAMSALENKLGGIETQMAALSASADSLQQQLASMLGQEGGLPGQLAGSDAAQQIQAMTDAMKGLQQFKDNLTGMQSMSLSEALDQLNAAGAAFAQGQGGAPGEGQGAGMGGPGIGEGGTWAVDPESGSPMQTSTVSGQMHPGRIMAAFYTEGGELKNESVVQYEEVVLESKAQAKSALSDQKVPRTHERIVREYFESLEGTR